MHSHIFLFSHAYVTLIVNKSCIMCELYKFIPLHHMEISLLLQFSAILNEAFIKIRSTQLCSIV